MSMPLSKSEILYLQRTCSVCGIYGGPLSGKWDAATEQAEKDLIARSAAIKAEFGTFDERTERNIATLMPPAQALARQFMKAAASFPLSVRILSGSRTYAEQDAIYAIGRTNQVGKATVTNAKGGQSNHNFGIAWDVGIFEANGRYMDGSLKKDDKAYSDLAALAKATVQSLEWGGDWKKFTDKPHYQLATGKSAAQVNSLFEAGKPLQT